MSKFWHTTKQKLFRTIAEYGIQFFIVYIICMFCTWLTVFEYADSISGFLICNVYMSLILIWCMRESEKNENENKVALARLEYLTKNEDEYIALKRLRLYTFLCRFLLCSFIAFLFISKFLSGAIERFYEGYNEVAENPLPPLGEVISFGAYICIIVAISCICSLIFVLRQKSVYRVVIY